MKIGIFAYQSACNYGAFLQILSTMGFLKKNGHEPCVINYEEKTLVEQYKSGTSEKTFQMYKDLRDEYFPLTASCTNEKELAEVIEKEGIEGVIIGSDAVVQHHPTLERLGLSKKTLFSVTPVTKDKLFPNPFWGTFTVYLKKEIPLALLSGSSQDSMYHLFSPDIKKEMRDSLSRFSYLSVRDAWTQAMFRKITKGKVEAPITPDPVFGFNYNCKEIIPSKEAILEKYHLPERYMLLSFKNSKTVSQAWLEEFEKLANEMGIACVALPFPEGLLFKQSLKYAISDSISPIDWYALIKYSLGYVGVNMHPIVVSLHNATPFFSFDNYGLYRFHGLYSNPKSSKIYHVLKRADLLDYHVSTVLKDYVEPSAIEVFKKVYNFDRIRAQKFSDSFYQEYLRNMTTILNALTQKQKTE